MSSESRLDHQFWEFMLIRIAQYFHFRLETGVGFSPDQYIQVISSNVRHMAGRCVVPGPPRLSSSSCPLACFIYLVSKMDLKQEDLKALDFGNSHTFQKQQPKSQAT